MPPSPNLRDVEARIEGLFEELRSASDLVVQQKTEELVRLLMELYGTGLERVLEIIAGDELGNEALIERLAEDDLVASLLILHGIHPLDTQMRVHNALEKVRPYLGSHAGGVEFLGVDEQGVAHLRLEGSCNGCPSSTVTVKLAIERAIEEAAPEVTRVEVEGVTTEQPSGPKLIQVIGPNGPVEDQEGDSAGSWVALEGLKAPLPGEMRTARANGTSIVVFGVQGSMYAYRNSCSKCGEVLDRGELENGTFTCAGCKEQYDVRLAGRSLDHPVDLHLDPLPLLQEQGTLKVAIPALSRL
jgi:Fe-S cluster biogenesis protein NfuA/nitrite reductase/ring-hydroxylating ferredoxin subunit